MENVPTTQLIRIDKYGNQNEIPVTLLNTLYPLEIPSVPCPDLWTVYLTNPIGEESSYGQVFSARCHPYGRFVFKRLLPSNYEDIENFGREAEFQNKIFRLNLTSPIYDAFFYEDEGNTYLGFITLELKQTVGQTIVEIFDNDKIDVTDEDKWRSSLVFIRQALEKLKMLHSYNIIHGDPNPNNFMLNNIGDVLLIDFGKTREMGRNKVDDIKKDYRIFLQSWSRFAKRQINFTIADTFNTLLENLNGEVKDSVTKYGDNFEEALVNHILTELGSIYAKDEETLNISLDE